MTTLGRENSLRLLGLSSGLLGGSLGGQALDQGEAARLIQQAARALEKAAPSFSSAGGLQRSDLGLREWVLRKIEQVYKLVLKGLLTEEQLRYLLDCLSRIVPDLAVAAALGLRLNSNPELTF